MPLTILLPSIISNVSTSYFDSPTHSDITICVAGTEIRAHKLILSVGSEFFKAAFEGRFSESNAPTLTLKDDDPAAIKGLLAWIYGLRYPVNFYSPRRGLKRPLRVQYSSEEKWEDWMRVPESNAEIVDHAKYLVNLYVAAGKYLVPRLQERVRESFETTVGWFRPEHSNAPEDSYVECIHQLAEHVFVTHDDAAVGLRKPVVRLIVAVLSGFWDNHSELERLREAVLEIPELCFELAAIRMGTGKHENTVGGGYDSLLSR